MTKPDDIPQDIMQQARAVFVAWSKIDNPSELLRVASGEFDTLPILDLTAKAIQGERERWQQMVAELEGLSLTEVISFDRLARERNQMAKDWCDFCEAIGVDVDTHEAVAAQIKGMFEP